MFEGYSSPDVVKVNCRRTCGLCGGKGKAGRGGGGRSDGSTAGSGGRGGGGGRGGADTAAPQHCADVAGWQDPTQTGKYGCDAWRGFDCDQVFEGYSSPAVVKANCNETCNLCGGRQGGRAPGPKGGGGGGGRSGGGSQPIWFDPCTPKVTPFCSGDWAWVGHVGALSTVVGVAAVLIIAIQDKVAAVLRKRVQHKGQTWSETEMETLGFTVESSDEAAEPLMGRASSSAQANGNADASDARRWREFAGWVCVIAGLASCTASMMSIHDAIPSETCVTRQGKTTCDDELTPLTKVKEVVFEPREYLGRREVWEGDDDTGGWVYRWPPAGALLGAMNLAVGLAVFLFGSTAVEHRRDAITRRMQRIPRLPSFVPAGEGVRVRKLRCSARRIFTRICCASPVAGSTQTASHVVQNVILFALLCKWIKPTERCTGASGGYGYGGEDDGGPQTCITQWPWMKDEDGDYEYLRRWGNMMGTVSGDCMALSMIPLPKNSLLLPALGIPFERALRFHRKLGQAAVATGLAHGLVYMGGWYSDPYGKDADGNALSGWAYMWQQCYPLCDRSTPELSKKCDDSFLPGGDNEHTWFLTSLGHHNSANFSGLVAAIGFLLILLTSFSWVRRNHYELFYKAHVVAAPCAMIGMWNHFSMAKLDVAIPFLLLMLGDYALRTYRSLRGDATIVSTKVFGDEGKAPFLAIEFSSSRFRVAEPGQYFFVRIPQLARLQWHPFSVSSAPEADNITIVLKDLGDWTHALCELPSAFVPDGSKLRIDGP